MKRNKILQIKSYLIVPIVILGAIGCKQAEKPQEIPLLVKIATVELYGGRSVVAYPGKIQAAENVKLAFRVAGPIKKIYVGEGELVKRGQLLAELDARDYQLQYNATRAEYNQVKGESDRVIELYRLGSVSVNEYDKAMAAKERITALYNAHRNALNDTKLKAPFDGYIQHKYFSASEIINQGTPVFSLINDNYFEVNVDIPVVDFVRRKDFISFSAVADAFPDITLPLELVDINQAANYNQLFNVRFRLRRDVAIGLAAGMSATVTIRYKSTGDDMTLVPVTALFQDAGNSYVWLLDSLNGEIRKMPVAVEHINKEGTALVASELHCGQMVVAAGVNELKEGQQVRKLLNR